MYGETTISTIRTKIAADKELKNQVESNNEWKKNKTSNIQNIN